MTAESLQRYRPDIDGMRAIAVGAVLLHHLGIPAFSGGYVGVDIFFVISGYLITGIIHRQMVEGTFHFSSFYVRRIRRIFPALLVTVALTLLGSYFVLPTAAYLDSAYSALAAIFSVSNIWFYSQVGYFDAEGITKPLLHTWSLGVEEQFYLFWPGILVLAFVGRRSLRLIIVLAALTLIGLVVSEVWVRMDSAGAFYLLPARVFEFGVGGLVVWLERQLRLGDRTRDAIVALGVAVLVASILLFSEDTPFPGLSAFVPVLATAAMLLMGSAKLTGRLLGNVAFVGIGRISYSLYLVHWPIIVLYRTVTYRDLTWIDWILVSLACLAMATILYFLVEKPFRLRGGASRSWPNARAFWRIGVVMAFAVFAALAVIWTEGFPQRVAYSNVAPDSEFVTAVKWIHDNCEPVEKYGDVRMCRVGDGQPSVALIGDSHARALSPVIGPAMQGLGKTLDIYHSPGTLPLLNVAYAQRGRLDEANFDESFTAVARSPVTDIILHARFALGWNGERPADESRPGKFATLKGNEPSTTKEQSQAAMLAGLRETIQFLQDNGKRVHIIGALPHLGINMADCVNRPLFLIGEQGIEKQCRGYTEAEAMERIYEANKQLGALATEMGAEYFDPSPLFCKPEQQRCDWKEGRILLYVDDDHLSPLGASRVWEAAQKYFTNLN